MAFLFSLLLSLWEQGTGESSEQSPLFALEEQPSRGKKKPKDATLGGRQGTIYVAY
jgi:hypothetical protein